VPQKYKPKGKHSEMKIRNCFYMSVMTAFLACGPAGASIIYNFTTVTPGTGANSGLFDWQYIAVLSPDQKVGPTTSAGAAAIDMATIFDFFGATSAVYSNVFAGITPTATLENTSPMAANQSVPDSAAVRNVRTNITGTATPSGTTAINLYTIDIFSTSGVRGSFDFQSGQALKNVPGDPTDGTVAGNTVSVEAPSVPTTVPEPASMVLLGSSLIGLGFLRRTQRS